MLQFTQHQEEKSRVKDRNLPIPMKFRNVPTKLMKDEGYGEGYEMYPEEGKSLLPEKLKGKKYFK